MIRFCFDNINIIKYCMIKNFLLMITECLLVNDIQKIRKIFYAALWACCFEELYLQLFLSFFRYMISIFQNIWNMFNIHFQRKWFREKIFKNRKTWRVLHESIFHAFILNSIYCSWNYYWIKRFWYLLTHSKMHI